ncbi:hypothetical protein [Enterococcus sp. AZ196]|uniref:hypothetical protein n=1 Tax=Enterococcus sp. AZ196 TaxID=2774659 RepID=UPI003D2952FF
MKTISSLEEEDELFDILSDVLNRVESDKKGSRERLADELNKVYELMESETAKKLVKSLENYTRYGNKQDEIK